MGRTLVSNFASLFFGEPVKNGQRLLSIEAMKMETAVYAPRDASVADVLVKPGSTIQARDLLVVLE